MVKKPVETPGLVEPPASLTNEAAEVWREIAVKNNLTTNVDIAALEAYSGLIARMRQARSRVEEEGMVVTDQRGRTIPHPALEVERALAEDVRKWGDKFGSVTLPTRKRGYVADATAESIAAAEHLQDKKFSGAVAAVKTLAWLIDESQREGMESLQKAGRELVPQYLKACADLQITPASVPTAAALKVVKSSGGSDEPVGKFARLQAARDQFKTA